MSFSVPTSPVVSRNSRANPVTPQRSSRQHRHSQSQSFYKSPLTPSTPYSLRSFTSAHSSGSSTLTTPNSAGDLSFNLNGLTLVSPEAPKSAPAGAKDKSLADIAQNWRSRANENGIKVSNAESPQTDSHYNDVSEQPHSDTTHDSSLVSNEEALLPPPFLSTHRRTAVTRPRAASYASLSANKSLPLSPTTVRSRPPTSPLVSRRLNQSQNLSLTCTPPPNRALARQLQLKGSLTDPAQPRRREAFGTVRSPSRNNTTFQDTSLNLFDIDENDFECDFLQGDEAVEDSFNFEADTSPNRQYGYPTFPQQSSNLLPSHLQQLHFFSQPQRAQQSYFADPFHPGQGLNTIAESVEHHFHSNDGSYLNGNRDFGLYQPTSQISGPLYPNPAFVPIPPSASSFSGQFHSTNLTSNSILNALLPKSTGNPVKQSSESKQEFKMDTSNDNPVIDTNNCSVCLAPNPKTLAILVPCGHPLCSGCLTSALNIVGEKDMECAVCKRGVADFKLVTNGSKPTTKELVVEDAKLKHGTNAAHGSNTGVLEDDESHKSFPDALFSSSSSPLLDDPENPFDLGEIRASTPVHQNKTKASSKRKENTVVLRIDNVPWDITPPQIKQWLQQPVERAHVLLDPKGKTMSHAFVEVRNAEIAGAILRGEGADKKRGGTLGGAKKDRGSVLGKGRRARGVTITRSSQEELMSDLFPSWRGTFDGSRPSLARLDGDRVIGALEGGLMNENEVKGLLHLIREPDSHFLKVPSLPFHSLISLLGKWPTDVDSRVFWSTAVRDRVYDTTFAAIQILISRVTHNSTSDPASATAQYDVDLALEVIQTALECDVFTSRQLENLSSHLDSCPLPSVQNLLREVDSRSSASDSMIRSEPVTPENYKHTGNKQAPRPFPSRSDTTTDTMNEREGSPAPFTDLAREFGVETQLVQALANRLSGLR